MASNPKLAENNPRFKQVHFQLPLEMAPRQATLESAYCCMPFMMRFGDNQNA